MKFILSAIILGFVCQVSIAATLDVKLRDRLTTGCIVGVENLNKGQDLNKKYPRYKEECACVAATHYRVATEEVVQKNGEELMMEAIEYYEYHDVKKAQKYLNTHPGFAEFEGSAWDLCEEQGKTTDKNSAK